MTDPSPVRRLRKSPYTLLLFSIVLLLGVWPVLAEFREDLHPILYGVIHGVLFSGLILSVVYAVRTARGKHWFSALLILAFLGTWADDLIDGAQTTLAGHALSAIFLLVATVFVIRRVITSGRITADRIIAAVCAYLFIGMFFASLYWMIWHLDPDAFSFPADEEVIVQSDFTYFSFTTLTTLGYGEITPVNPGARSLAYLEATLGQIFIAVVIARLVALEIVHGRHDRLEDDD